LSKGTSSTTRTIPVMTKRQRDASLPGPAHVLSGKRIQLVYRPVESGFPAPGGVDNGVDRFPDVVRRKGTRWPEKLCRSR
jgi:hypothetical protein